MLSMFYFKMYHGPEICSPQHNRQKERCEQHDNYCSSSQAPDALLSQDKANKPGLPDLAN